MIFIVIYYVYITYIIIKEQTSVNTKNKIKELSNNFVF